MEREGNSGPLDWLSENPEANSKNRPSFWLRLSIYSCDYHAREYAWKKLKSFSAEEIVSDLEEIIKIANACRAAEEKVTKILESLPAAVFEKKLTEVLSLANRKETAETATIILRALPASSLSPYFVTIQNWSRSEGLIIMRSLMCELMAKIIKSWSLEQKERNLELILKFEKGQNQLLSEAATLAHLEVMKSWPVEKLLSNLDYLVQLSNSRYLHIPYLAAELALSFFNSEFSYQGIQEIYLDYLKSFINWGDKDIRQGFRQLALQTISNSLWISPDKHVDFLICCLDSRSRQHRSLVLRLLRKVSDDNLPLEHLLLGQCSGLKRVRHHTRRLVSRVGNEKLLENLKLLFEAQKSSNCHYRNLAFSLVLKIPRAEILKQQDLLDHYRESPNLQVGLLAKMLVDFN
ncbi:MAG: hypothetical protein JST_000485 [Candidatus Parcubacteria bacterium]|jgi:hypothetical protein|nr:MAG: hypothetical protein JST_4520 [Candidatus Parcubacteria bacterium]